MSMSKYALYERLKREIAADSKSDAEYQRRIKALAKKLKI